MADDFDLTSYDSAFNKAEVRDGAEVPHGKYHVEITKADIEPHPTSGELQWKWTLKVIGPAHVGRLMWKNHNITEKGMTFLKTDLYTCGLKVQTLTEAAKQRSALIGVKLEVDKKPQAKNPKYSDIYFNKRLSEDVGGGSGAAGADENFDKELGF